jgi:hypothetical protein
MVPHKWSAFQHNGFICIQAMSNGVFQAASYWRFYDGLLRVPQLCWICVQKKINLFLDWHCDADAAPNSGG